MVHPEINYLTTQNYLQFFGFVITLRLQLNIDLLHEAKWINIWSCCIISQGKNG